MARYQSKVIHREIEYDLIIDTTGLTAPESALQIKHFIENHPPTALRQLYHRYGAAEQREQI